MPAVQSQMLHLVPDFLSHGAGKSHRKYTVLVPLTQQKGIDWKVMQVLEMPDIVRNTGMEKMLLIYRPGGNGN